MTEQLINNGIGILNADITSAATSLTLATGQGSLFPSSGNFRIRIDSELIIVGARSGDTLSSLTRGAESTSAAIHSSGATVQQVLTKAGLDQYITDHYVPLSAKGDLLVYGSAPTALAVGADGKVITADSSQTDGVKWAYPSGYEYAHVTSVSTLTTSSTSITQCLAFPAATFDGGAVWFTFTTSAVKSSAGGAIGFWFGEGGSVISNVSYFYPPSSSIPVPVAMSFRYTPTAGSHTFQILWTATSGNTNTLDAANNTTPYGRITKV